MWGECNVLSWILLRSNDPQYDKFAAEREEISCGTLQGLAGGLW